MDIAALLKDKHVLITGASSGLGQHFAHLCARSGARVTVAARRKDRLDALAGELRRLGSASVTPLMLDVSDDAAVHEAMAGMSTSVDVLVNNAGTNDTGPAIDAPIDTLDGVMDTNLRGPWSMSVACARRWRHEQRGGAIVNIASVLASRLVSGLAAYSVSKAAIVKMTEAHALEWARYGIRVNALAPGYISTDMNRDYLEGAGGQAMVKRIPLRRFGRPDDLDAAFLVLATEASAWMTGTTITIDGGHSLTTL